MKIKIRGLDILHRGIINGLSEYQRELEKEYGRAVQEVAARIASDARANLAGTQLVQRPGRANIGAGNWLLSKSIRDSKLKLYEDRHIIFQAVEPEGNRAPTPGSPAAYAWYQEHGWVVSAKTVKRPRAGRLITTDRKGRSRKAVYRRQEGKKFFERAAQTNLPKLERMIAEINAKTELKLQR